MTDQTTKKPRRKFTYKMLRAIALSYDTREALKIGDRYAYQLMHKLGKADEYCAHMQPPGMSTKWTLENLQAEASKYSKRWDFRRGNSAAYSAAVRRGLINKICAHMPKKEFVMWTVEMLHEEAAKYQRRNDFRTLGTHAYNSARRRGLLDQVCAHMPKRKGRTIVIAKPPGKRRYDLQYEVAA